MRGKVVFSLLVLAMALSGCATTPQSDILMVRPPQDLRQAVELNAVAFFPQQAYQCGPAALATLLNSSGVEVTPGELTSQVYLPERQGSLQVELVATVRRYGLIAYELEPSLLTLMQEVQSGRPVLVLQNLGTNWHPVWHYAVVVGYDLAANTIVLRSGERRRHVVGMRVFERTWQRGRHWALLTVAPGNVPLTMQRSKYIRAVIELEKAGKWGVAARAYRAGLQRWAGNTTLAMGLGNSLYKQGQLDDAARQFAQILEHHSHYAPAHNNLAQVYLELGKLEEALLHARKAVTGGGKHAAVFQQTLRLVEFQQQTIRNE